MYPYLGDFELGKTIFFPFDTFNSTGASVTITGLATSDIEIYKGASMTQRASDAGYALVDTDGIDLDGTTGLHGFTVDTNDNTDAGFFAAGNDYTVVVASVTVDAQTCNKIVGRFSLSNRAGLKPTVEGRTLDVSAGGEAGLDLTNVGTLTGAYPFLGILDSGTAQSATGTTLVLRAAAAFANDTIIGSTLLAFGSTQGYWQVRTITDVDLATDTVTVDTWTVTPSGTITYIIFAGSPASTSLPIPVNVTQFGGVAGTFSGGRPEVKTFSMEPASIVAATFGAGAIDAAATAADFVTEVQSGLATQASVDDLPTNAELATALAAADDAVLAAIAALENLSAAEVNAEVVDALATDTYVEPGQGSPAATASLAAKLNYLFKAWRNRSTQTATEYALFADDGSTKDQEAACSDDGTTFVRGEIATGA